MQFAEFGAAKAARLRESDGLQPEFGVAFGLLDVDVARLRAFTTEVEKSVAANSQDFWYPRNVSEQTRAQDYRPAVRKRPNGFTVSAGTGATVPARVASYAYVNPVVAVFLGWLLLHEPIGPRTLVASVIIVTAVAIITVEKTRPAKTA